MPTRLVRLTGALMLLLPLLLACSVLADAAGMTSTGQGVAPRTCAGGTAAAFEVASNYVGGTLACASAEDVTVALTGTAPATVRVHLDAATQICRAARGCHATWRDLGVGDRVDVGIASGSTGQPVARWIDANMVTGYGTIRARTAWSVTLVLLRPSHLTATGGTCRVVNLTAWTTVDTAGHKYMGSAGSLRIGESVYFVASADSSHLQTAHLWATLIAQITFAKPS